MLRSKSMSPRQGHSQPVRRGKPFRGLSAKATPRKNAIPKASTAAASYFEPRSRASSSFEQVGCAAPREPPSRLAALSSEILLSDSVVMVTNRALRKRGARKPSRYVPAIGPKFDCTVGDLRGTEKSQRRVRNVHRPVTIAERFFTTIKVRAGTSGARGGSRIRTPRRARDFKCYACFRV